MIRNSDLPCLTSLPVIKVYAAMEDRERDKKVISSDGRDCDFGHWTASDIILPDRNRRLKSEIRIFGYTFTSIFTLHISLCLKKSNQPSAVIIIAC